MLELNLDSLETLIRGDNFILMNIKWLTHGTENEYGFKSVSFEVQSPVVEFLTRSPF
jgi:hypothetical protein